MPKIIEKTCTYGVTKAKSHYYDAQKIQIIYDFLLKSFYSKAQKYWKNYVLNAWPRQNHATIMPKKYR